MSGFLFILLILPATPFYRAIAFGDGGSFGFNDGGLIYVQKLYLDDVPSSSA
jgi:hypothetical protein